MTEDRVMYVVYSDPKDYPGKFVVRKFIGTLGDFLPSLGDFKVCESYTSVLRYLPRGLICIEKSERDENCILETWLDVKR